MNDTTITPGAPDQSTVDAAVHAVRRAARVTASAQSRIGSGETLTKDDHSPVTIADFAAQAIVCLTLDEALGAIAVVGEEDASDLDGEGAAGLLDGVAQLVGEATGDPVSGDDVKRWVGLGGSDTARERYWTLDPIDGTKGFLRGDQYAIALALIERGEVVLGVLGCPNMANDDGSTGATFVAAGGEAVVYHGDSETSTPVSVSQPASLAEARFCESVESGHSDQDQSAQIAERLGITLEPFRIDSQCKYGAVARGDASIYLRLPTRADYVEKIWDHAAGKFVVEQAGGTVTDVDGRPLDFSRGARLAANRGVVATSGGFHDEVVDAVRSVLG